MSAEHLLADKSADDAADTHSVRGIALSESGGRSGGTDERSLVERGRAAARWLDGVAEEHGSDQVWAMFSGGDDSLANVLVTSLARQFRGCIHIDTGIGIPQTQEFVRDTCRRHGWPLRIFRAADVDTGKPESSTDYETLVRSYGFPGPAMHWKMFQRLKERAFDAFMRETKRHRYHRIILSSGVRQQESERRMGHARKTHRDGCAVWANPIFEWSKLDTIGYAETLGAKRSPVASLIHKSGECLCGCFAKPGERKELRLWFPEVAERIDRLEAEARARGFDWGWGERPTTKKRPGKVSRDSAGRTRISPLCQQCPLKGFEGPP